MTKEKKELNAKAREIIRVIHKKGGAMTPNEIAMETGFSYITVTKYMMELVKRGVLIEVNNEKNKQNKEQTDEK
jgi:uncharacterized membrane protein